MRFSKIKVFGCGTIILICLVVVYFFAYFAYATRSVTLDPSFLDIANQPISELKAYIRDGGDVNASYYLSGETLLFRASARLDLEYCTILLENGAARSLQHKIDKLYKAPLDFAIGAPVLYRYQFSKSTKPLDGETDTERVLRIRGYREDGIKLFRLFQKYMVKSELAVACGNKDVEAVRNIVDDGLILAQFDPYWIHPLSHAILQEDEEIFEILLSAKDADSPLISRAPIHLEKPSDVYNVVLLTPMCVAASIKDVSWIKRVHEAGGAINEVGGGIAAGDSVTPLRVAALWGNIEVFSYLLDHGADPGRNDKMYPVEECIKAGCGTSAIREEMLNMLQLSLGK